MKKFITKYAAYVVLAAAIAMLIPGIMNRVNNENKNDNIVISVLYHDVANKVSKPKLDSFLDECLQNGVNTISVKESDVNYLVQRGDVTCIKYNVLRHKYDEESVRLATFIEENCPNVSYDSHIVIADKDEAKQIFAREMSRRYTEKEYADLGPFEGRDIYVLYDGRKQLWDYSLGYDEATIKSLADKGFEIALVHKVSNYGKTDYIEDIDAIVKKYNVRYLNLKEDAYAATDVNKLNYIGISKIIADNDMTLVLTENPDQLSNQKFLGYDYIYQDVVKEGGTNKVMRSYETYDDSQSDATFYKHRVEQYLNSTIDRSLRFITVTQIAVEDISYDECADYTIKAMTEYKDKIEEQGFRINDETNPIDYTVRRKVISALCAIIMVMSLLIVCQMITGKKSFALTVGAILAAGAAALATFVMPSSLLYLYPTAFCIIQSCTAMTAMLYFIKVKSQTWNVYALTGGALLVMMGTLMLGAMCLGTLVSGLDYYVNNNIFRGIKLSLLVPVAYTTVVYYFMFIKAKKRSVVKDLGTVLNAQIKVYWVIIAGVILVVAGYYLLRSGNVSEISSLEGAMRSALTNLFSVRPRTKEFLIGYPALVLFVYYAKKTDCQLIRWILATAMSILAASVTNSFCHVFTNFSVITMRTINGLIVGLVIAAVVYVLNLILVKIICVLKDKYKQTRR